MEVESTWLFRRNKILIKKKVKALGLQKKNYLPFFLYTQRNCGCFSSFVVAAHFSQDI